MRNTTERPEGVAAGTAFLTGPNASAIIEHATRLLTDEAAYRSMAGARNPYGDGYATERIVERLRRYFAARDLASRWHGGIAPDSGMPASSFRGENSAMAKSSQKIGELVGARLPARLVHLFR
jgi:hypothetical protein